MRTLRSATTAYSTVPFISQLPSRVMRMCIGTERQNLPGDVKFASTAWTILGIDSPLVRVRLLTSVLDSVSRRHPRGASDSMSYRCDPPVVNVLIFLGDSLFACCLILCESLSRSK